MAHIKKIEISNSVKILEGKYHPIKDWAEDPNGYFLIRLNEDFIELGFCRKNNIIEIIIKGKTPQEIYNTAIKHGLLSRLDHAAYLGKELEKAHIALKHNLKYIQDEELEI